MQINFLVRVSCMTYNHAPYIEDAMNGFCMQETTFPFVCTIIDDASTDGEPEVIKKYLQKHFDLEDKAIIRNEETDDYVMTFAQHRTNKNCYFAVYYLKYNHYSIKKSKMPYFHEWTGQVKYIAICEGDDFWIASEKLQRQVNCLQALPDVNMCAHAYNLVSKDKTKIGEVHSSTKDGLLNSGLVIENVKMPQYATLLFRAHHYENRPDFFNYLDVGDYQLRVFFAINGGIYYINAVMSSYRRFSNMSWTSQMRTNNDKYLSHVEKMKKFALELDEYTNKEYHQFVLRRIEHLDYLIQRRIGSLKSIVKTKYFNSLGYKHKARLLVEIIFPVLIRELKVLYYLKK